MEWLVPLLYPIIFPKIQQNTQNREEDWYAWQVVSVTRSSTHSSFEFNSCDFTRKKNHGIWQSARCDLAFGEHGGIAGSLRDLNRIVTMRIWVIWKDSNDFPSRHHCKPCLGLRRIIPKMTQFQNGELLWDWFCWSKIKLKPMGLDFKFVGVSGFSFLVN